MPFDDTKPMDWKRYSPEGAQLSLDLPGEPLEMTPVLPTEMKGSKLYAAYGKQPMAVVMRVVASRFLRAGHELAGWRSGRQ